MTVSVLKLALEMLKKIFGMLLGDVVKHIWTFLCMGHVELT